MRRILLVLGALMLVAALSTPAVVGQKAGFKASVFQRSFDMATQFAVPAIRGALTTLSIPPVSGSGGAPIIGTIHYSLSDLAISGFDFSAPVIRPWGTNGVSLTIGNLKASVNLNFHWEKRSFPKAKGGGGAVASIGGAGATFIIAITDQGDRPVASVQSASVSIGSMDVRVVSGGTKWLYNWLLGKLRESIKGQCEKALSSAILPAFAAQANRFLATVPLVMPVNQYATFDAHLISNLIVTPDRITIPLLGAINPPGLPTAFLPTDDLPDMIDGPTTMVEFIVGDYVINTAAHTAEYQGKFNFTLTPENYPTSPIPLNTDAWSRLVPSLNQKYPSQPLQIVVGPAQRPRAGSIAAAQGIKGEIVLNAAFNVNGERAFTLRVDVAVAAGIYLNGARLSAKVTQAVANCSVTQTNIGDIEPALLNKAIQSAIDEQVLPQINGFIATGIPLPLPDFFKMVSVKIVYGNGWFGMSADLNV